MPFRASQDGDGQRINFDAVYHALIRPAVIDSGLDPLRADEGHQGGVFQKTMFEQLDVCEFADRGSLDGQRQRLLRARPPAREESAQHRPRIPGRLASST